MSEELNRRIKTITELEYELIDVVDGVKHVYAEGTPKQTFKVLSMGLGLAVMQNGVIHRLKTER